MLSATYTPLGGVRDIGIHELSCHLSVLSRNVLQEGGADVIELGVPFTDPQADGTTIQATNQVVVSAFFMVSYGI